MDQIANYKDSSFIKGALKILLPQIREGRNDVPSAAQDMEVSVEEFRRLVRIYFPHEVLPD